MWTLYSNGSSFARKAGAGIILISPDKEEYNNEAEYEALFSGIRIAMGMKVKHLQAYVNSQLVAKKVTRIFEANEDIMKVC